MQYNMTDWPEYRNLTIIGFNDLFRIMEGMILGSNHWAGGSPNLTPPQTLNGQGGQLPRDECS